MFTADALLALGRRLIPYVLGAAIVVAFYLLFTGWLDGVKADERAAQKALDQRVIDKLESDVRQKTAEAAAADQAHARAVEAAQATISNEVSHDYETKLAALRARLDQLRRAAAEAHPAGGGGREQPDVPGVSVAARESDDAAGTDGLHGGGIEAPDRSPIDALLGLAFEADANTVNLIALQRWLAEQLKVER
jgi:signal transduction histidine kinase